MWLIYPLFKDDIARARWGARVLIFASILWYVLLISTFAIATQDMMIKVDGKFTDMPSGGSKKPFLILTLGWALVATIRQIGYMLMKTVAVALGASEHWQIARLGALIWLGTGATLYFGFSGLIGVVAAAGTALELRLIRVHAMLFSMTISQESLRYLSWYFYARSAWLVCIAIASLILLTAHAILDVPRISGSPTDQLVGRVQSILRIAFNIFAGFAVMGTGPITVCYWYFLLQASNAVEKLIDPNGPAVAPPGDSGVSVNQLKDLLQNPYA